MTREDMRTIMKRAWQIVKTEGKNISEGLKKSWAEFEKGVKKAMKRLEEMLRENLENMMYNDYHINAGVEREAKISIWEKGDKKRAYLEIVCFTMNGRYKGKYKAGYVDLVTNEYVTTKYDEIDAKNMEWIGR